MRTRLLLLSALFLTLPAARAAETSAEHAARVYADREIASHPVHGNLPDYTLSPAQLAKANHLDHIGTLLTLGGMAWGIAQPLLLLGVGLVARMRNRALKVGRSSRWAQGYTFLLLYLLATFLLGLPLSLYGHHLSVAFGFSVQHWGSWFVDRFKSLALTWLFGGLLVMLLFWVIRTFPRRWWFVFWAASVPISVFVIFIGPYVNFLFNHYEPLAHSNPALVQQIEQVVAKGHMNIPPGRMFLMRASEKTTTLNADVEGFGASKRVVIWDNTVRRMTPNQVLAIFGHESGHYVLGHVVRGFYISIVFSFVVLLAGFLFLRWAIARFGAAWGIPSQQDWGALAVLLLAISLLSLPLEPAAFAISRVQEHAADVYGQEAIHGLVPDPQAVMQSTFQVLGEVSAEDPNPPAWETFLMDTHPSTGFRAAFAHAYNPWAPGGIPKYFPPAAE